jgi:Icc-related predicted phosphoesterase
LLGDRDIKGSLRGLLERGVQVAKDAEESANDYVMLSVGYAGAVGTSLWAEIKEDRIKVISSYLLNFGSTDPKF